MFAQTRSPMKIIFRLPPARAAFRRLDGASRKVTNVGAYQAQSKAGVGPTLLLAASAAAAAAATTAAIAPSLCEEDRLGRWNDRWATGKVVRFLLHRLSADCFGLGIQCSPSNLCTAVVLLYLNSLVYGNIFTDV